jgi:hypothetical protein
MDQCTIVGCERKIKSRGWCNSHYVNWLTYGNPIPQRDWTLGERIKKTGWTVTKNGCWEWNGRKNWCGYGMINITRLGIINQRAHRVVFEYLTGEKIGDRVLCHHCDNPPCVNPEHLFMGTMADNMRDKIEKGRNGYSSRVKCINGHDLTLVGAIKTCHRKNRRSENLCVKCDIIRKSKWYLKKKTYE